MSRNKLKAILACAALAALLPAAAAQDLIAPDQIVADEVKYTTTTAEYGTLARNLNVVGSEREMNYLLDAEGVLTLWYGSDMERRYTYNKADARLGDSLQRIPTYEDILSLDPASIRAAGCFQTEDGKWRILVSAVDPDFGYLDSYSISLDTGLLVGAEQWDGDTLIYQMTAGEADLSAPADQLFLLSS